VSGLGLGREEREEEPPTVPPLGVDGVEREPTSLMERDQIPGRVSGKERVEKEMPGDFHSLLPRHPMPDVPIVISRVTGGRSAL
jgi:hypothetical protein